jgi:hypothetical protein
MVAGWIFLPADRVLNPVRRPSQQTGDNRAAFLYILFWFIAFKVIITSLLFNLSIPTMLQSRYVPDAS